jgi:Skp family chaperone for outer membrane proteins
MRNWLSRFLLPILLVVSLCPAAFATEDLRVGYFNLALIKAALGQSAETQRIKNAVDKVASDNNLNLVVDGSAVFAGGEQIVTNGVNIGYAISQEMNIRAGEGPPGKKAATPFSTNLAYFNLAAVQNSLPSFIEAQKAKMAAELQLRQAVVDGNNSLKQAQTDGRSKTEIEAMARDLKVTINQQQQTLIKQVQAQQQAANAALAAQIAQIAKQRNLGLVVDTGGVFKGGTLFVSASNDLTSELQGQHSTTAVFSAAPVASPSPQPAAPRTTSGDPITSKAALDADVQSMTSRIQSNPNDKDAYLRRAITYLTSGEGAKASTDAMRLMELTGNAANASDEYQQQLSIILLALTYEKAGEKTKEADLLKLAQGRVNRNSWPYPVIGYLDGSVTESALTTGDPERDTEAKYYVGIHKLISGNMPDAISTLLAAHQGGSAQPDTSMASFYSKQSQRLLALLGN